MNASIHSAELTVSSRTLGAMLTSIQCDGIEYLWQGDPEFWADQAPVCFPICGSLRGNRAECSQGEVKDIKRHGFARFEEFCEEKRTDSELTYLLRSSEKTKAMYPYDFEFRVSYAVEGRSLTFRYDITNTGKVDLPFFIGGHPAYRCPLLPGEDYTDYEIRFEKEEYADCMYPLESEKTLLDEDRRRVIVDHDKVLKLNHDLFPNDGLVFDDLRSRSLCYLNPKTGKGVRVDFSDFSNLVIWSTVKSAEFVAIEPWNGFSTKSSEDDVLEHKDN